MGIRDSIQNGRLSSSLLSSAALNNPVKGRQTAFFGAETAAFYEQNGEFASDCFLADCEGLDPGDFFTAQRQKIRLSNLLPASASSSLREDWKNILFLSAGLDYVGQGARITVGAPPFCQHYLVTDADNLSSVRASCIARRENAAWRFLDFYGKLVSEGFVWDKGTELFTTGHGGNGLALLGGYQHSAMQLNSNTSLLSDNTRMILGKSAYFVRGLVNFLQEFSGDDSSCHLMHFDLERTEPLESDDLLNGIAGGLAFSWEIQISGSPLLQTGRSAQLRAASLRNGEIISSTAALPISYLWSCDTPAIATVDGGGLVTALSPGICTIRAALLQNPDMYRCFELKVEGAATGDYVAFTSPLPGTLAQYSTLTLTAAYFKNGIETDTELSFLLGGADKACYEAKVFGNRLDIQCFAPCDRALTVRAVAPGGEAAAASVWLEGY
ncbi:MAG: hypothetical protein RR431_08095 [Clostridia bacterium]